MYAHSGKVGKDWFYLLITSDRENDTSRFCDWLIRPLSPNSLDSDISVYSNICKQTLCLIPLSYVEGFIFHHEILKQLLVQIFCD